MALSCLPWNPLPWWWWWWWWCQCVCVYVCMYECMCVCVCVCYNVCAYSDTFKAKFWYKFDIKCIVVIWQDYAIIDSNHYHRDEMCVCVFVHVCNKYVCLYDIHVHTFEHACTHSMNVCMYVWMFDNVCTVHVCIRRDACMYFCCVWEGLIIIKMTNTAIQNITQIMIMVIWFNNDENAINWQVETWNCDI